MELFESADGGSEDGIRDLAWTKICLQRPSVALTGEPRYLNPLWVFGNPSDSTNNNFKLRGEKNIPHHQEVQDKIRAALKLLTFREQHILIQFWSSHVVGKHRLLKTVDQPFGLGVVNEQLCSYRRDSERNVFVVDEDHEDDDVCPPARVLRRGLPEWTCDVACYSPADFPQQDRALSCNLRGYVALPVFDSPTGLCVGVLELLTSSNYTDYAYEVQQVHRALKTENLASPQVFDSPHSNVPNERRQHQLDKIFSILKVLCDTHNLPLAQTWAVSPFSSFVVHGKNIEKSCSSFNTRCIGKVCMSTAALPFHVRDLGMWYFREASRERHLEKSRGVVGRTLLSHGSCFCADVTKLSEDEYSLAHHARMNGLTSCFAIYLQGVGFDDDYVLEFFLPLDIKDDRDLLMNLAHTLRQDVEVSFGFEVVGLPTEPLNIEADITPTSTATMDNCLTFSGWANQTDSSYSQSMFPSIAKSVGADVPNQFTFCKDHTKQWDGLVVNNESFVGDDVINNIDKGQSHNVATYPKVNMQKTGDIFSSGGQKSDTIKQNRKRKTESLTMEAIEQYFGSPIGEAAVSLGVSRSTLKRFCREHKIPSWPLPPRSKKNVRVFNSKLSEKSGADHDMERLCPSTPSNLRFHISSVAFLLVRLKRWRCRSNGHGISGKWWICCNFNSLLSSHNLSEESHSSVIGTAIQCSTSSVVCFGIYEAAFLFVGLIRWRKKCWLRQSRQYKQINLTGSTGKPEHTAKFLYPYQAGELQIGLPFDMLHASPKRNGVNALEDARKVTVKATFKDSMIKFQFRLSSGLQELENQVAERFKLKSKSFHLKYKDEEGDMIFIACDADLHNLLASPRESLKVLVVLPQPDG